MGMPELAPEPEVVANNEILRDNLGMGREQDLDSEGSGREYINPALRGSIERRRRDLGIAHP